MRLWILVNHPPVSEDTAYLVGRTASHFDEVVVTRLDETQTNVPVPPRNLDAILNRSFITNSRFLLSLDELALEQSIPVINTGQATIAACDKRSYVDVYRDFIPETWLVRNTEDLAEQQKQRGDLVIKNPYGKHGRQVERFSGVTDTGIAEGLRESSPDGELVVQEFLSGFVDGDKRIIVQRSTCGNYDIVAWFKRVPADGNWKSNVSSGGRIESCELESVEIEMALEVAARSGLDYVGIDTAWHGGRCWLIETNAYTGGHVNFDTERRVHSGDQFAAMVNRIACTGCS